MTQLPLTLVSVEAMAREFARVLCTYLGRVDMVEVILRNKEQADPNICHSHDFCDANMAMSEARINLGLAESPDMDDEAQVALWNDAWALAKSTAFLSADALACKAKAEAMSSPKELDDWYEANVGRRLLDDEPSLTLIEQRADVASMMFFDTQPEGLDSPGAEAMQAGLWAAITGKYA